MITHHQREDEKMITSLTVIGMAFVFVGHAIAVALAVAIFEFVGAAARTRRPLATAASLGRTYAQVIALFILTGVTGAALGILVLQVI